MNSARELGRLLRARGATVAVAESCTGGSIGARITDVGGSSRYFLGGVIAYDNRVKRRLLGVSAETLTRFGAVSRPVARRMAEGVRRRIGADFGIAITGVAGPGGGTARKPVGLVFVAAAGPGGTRIEKHCFSGSRAAVRRAGRDAAIKLLIRILQTQGE